MSDEMTASLRRRLSSLSAPPLEDDDLLAEILLRLPPLPSSLPRASAVSRCWHGLASDPRFCSRFRAHHRRNPPLLGWFIENDGDTRFQPALEAPNRVTQGRFSFPIDADSHLLLLGCRHGLALSVFHDTRKKLLVWDPVIGDQHRLDIPPWFDGNSPISAAVLRTAGDVRYFQVVLVGGSDWQPNRTAGDVRYFQVVLVGGSDWQPNQVVASVYSSKTNIWGNLTTPPVPHMYVHQDMPAVMIGDSLYWLLLRGDSFGILEFDVGRRSLSVIPMPGEEIFPDGMLLGDFWVVMAEGGGLGVLLVSGFNAQLWKRKTNYDGVALWVLQRTIALNKLLSLNPEKERRRPVILGFAEDNNVVLLWTSIGVFTVQLESLQFKKLSEPENWESHCPFEAVYTAEHGIDDGHVEAGVLQNT